MVFLTIFFYLIRFLVLYIFFVDVALGMAKQQRKWFAPEQLSQPYHDEMHLQSYHQKHKFVTKSNAIKNPSRNNFARKNRYLKKFNKTFDKFP